MKAVDLHTHSNASDGSDSPSAVIDLAVWAGLSAIALTDHDTIDGLPEALYRGEMYPDLEVIPGIEFSTEYDGRDIHIVGLYIRYDDPLFTEPLTRFKESRNNRNIKMCSNLQEAGIDITYEKLQDKFPGSVVTRAHYARYLLEGGYVGSIKEAFDRYVGDHTRYFVPREKVTPWEAISLIKEASGVPILAHPVLYGMGSARLEELVKLCKEAGLAGLECTYSTYAPSDERDMKRLSDKYDLLYSGGSDYHGAAKPDISIGCGRGHLYVPDEYLIRIKNWKDAQYG